MDGDNDDKIYVENGNDQMISCGTYMEPYGSSHDGMELFRSRVVQRDVLDLIESMISMEVYLQFSTLRCRGTKHWTVTESADFILCTFTTTSFMSIMTFYMHFRSI